MLKTQQNSIVFHLLLYYLALPIFTYSCFSCESRYFHLFDDSEGIKDGSSHMRKAYGLRSKCFWLPRFVAMKMNNKSLLLHMQAVFYQISLPQDRKKASLQSDFQVYYTQFVVVSVLNECRRMSINTFTSGIALFLSAKKIRVTISFTTNRHRSGVLQDDQH